ncbi:hypothetical protein T03_15793 [Trichinella britovi]|uniref:PiggyBac transposable element-derived protein domain-containing protein n=1 Tax=Trichinella britovi TaxID=45882 RepID=A0A0V1CE15_TRIBR|nr:hypothetical protein T03_15793 [Trichinella britovi]
MIPGHTRYALNRITDIASSIALFVPTTIENVILEMTNLKGRSCCPETWKPLDVTDSRAYIGLLILARVNRSQGEATKSLWNAENGRAIFPAVISLKKFHLISRMIRFDDHSSRASHRSKDKLAAVRVI